jgi:hypothetical protein
MIQFLSAPPTTLEEKPNMWVRSCQDIEEKLDANPRHLKLPQASLTRGRQQGGHVAATRPCPIARGPPPWARAFTEAWAKPIAISIDVSYAAPQAHGIVNIALHREYSPGIIIIFSQGSKVLYHV